MLGILLEHINPGDKLYMVKNIKKVTLGSTLEIADIVDGIYNIELVNDTHKASFIKVAEASKIIENSQRGVDIAFMNELAKFFNAMGIDTNEVIEAAVSKWNFIKLKPGLIGGYCISVDPYYLIQKAQDMVCAFCDVTCPMFERWHGRIVAYQIINHMNLKEVMVKDAKILIFGITFKRSCPNIRNIKVEDIYMT